jgi:hypothetical protein
VEHLAVATVLPVVALALLHLVVAGLTTPRARTTVVSATMIGVIATAPEAQTMATAR